MGILKPNPVAPSTMAVTVHHPRAVKFLFRIDVVLLQDSNDSAGSAAVDSQANPPRLAGICEGLGCQTFLELFGGASRGYCLGPLQRSLHHRRSLHWLILRRPGLLAALGLEADPTGVRSTDQEQHHQQTAPPQYFHADPFHSLSSPDASPNRMATAGADADSVRTSSSDVSTDSAPNRSSRSGTSATAEKAKEALNGGATRETVCDLLQLAIIELTFPLIPHYMALSHLQKVLTSSDVVQQLIESAPKYDVSWDAVLFPLLMFCRRACVSDATVDDRGEDLPMHPFTPPPSMTEMMTDEQYLLHFQSTPLSARVRFQRVDEAALQCLAIFMRDLRSGNPSSLFRAFGDSLLPVLRQEWPLHLTFTVNGVRALCAVLYYTFIVHCASLSRIMQLLFVLHQYLSVHAPDLSLRSTSFAFLGERQRYLLTTVVHARSEEDDCALDCSLTVLGLMLHIIAFVEHQSGKELYLGARPPEGSRARSRSAHQVDACCAEEDTDYGDRQLVPVDPTVEPIPEYYRPLPPTAPTSRSRQTAHQPDLLRVAIDRLRMNLAAETKESWASRASSALWKYRRIAQWLGQTQCADGGFGTSYLGPVALAAWSGGALNLPPAQQSHFRSKWRQQMESQCGGRQAAAEVLASWSNRELTFAE